MWPFEDPEELLKRLKALVSAADAGKIIDKLYPILTTLDAKANGLLRVNSLFLTIVIAFVGWAKSAGQSAVAAHSIRYIISYVTIALLGLSAFLCMIVVRVSWQFLGKVNPKDTSTTDTSLTGVSGETTYSFKAEIAALAKAASRRTTYYQMAWWLTLIGLIALALVAVAILSNP